MSTVRAAGVDANGKIYADLIPDQYVTDADLDNRLALLPVPATSAASTTAAGVVELATAAEATAGTDASRAVTPAALAAALGFLPIGASPIPEANQERHLFPAGSPLAWPPRPAWTGPVVFNAKGQTVTRPSNDGQVTGGGGMVPLLDEYRT